MVGPTTHNLALVKFTYYVIWRTTSIRAHASLKTLYLVRKYQPNQHENSFTINLLTSTLVLGERDIQPCDGFCYVHKSNSTLVGDCDIDLAIMKMHEAVRKISGSSLILTIVSSFIILIILLLGYVWLRLRPKEEDFSRSSTYLTSM